MDEDWSESASGSGEFLLYQTDDGASQIRLRAEGGTVWLSQAEIAELFQTSKQNVSHHIQSILEDGELPEDRTVKNHLTVRQEGTRSVRRTVALYSLEMILAVGYRVRSHRGTQFRQWATTHLREYLVKGFVMDDARLKEPGGWDYFDELLERIRDIRASEKVFYRKITDIYARCSVDYDPKSPLTQTFYATVQNKLHWAIHGHTAAELIAERADETKPNMGLSNWKNAPAGPIRKSDITTAKSYLTEDELKSLNRIVTMYLDYAEDQAERRRAMTMQDWAKLLDGFLTFNGRDILNHAGRVSKELAEQTAMLKFEKYKAQQRYLEASQPASDFDRFIDETKRLKGNDDR